MDGGSEGLFRRMTLGDGVGSMLAVFAPRYEVMSPNEKNSGANDALVQETLDLSRMIEGVGLSLMEGAGAATAAATNREARNTFKNMISRIYRQRNKKSFEAGMVKIKLDGAPGPVAL